MFRAHFRQRKPVCREVGGVGGPSIPVLTPGIRDFPATSFAALKDSSPKFALFMLFVA